MPEMLFVTGCDMNYVVSMIYVEVRALWYEIMGKPTLQVW